MSPNDKVFWRPILKHEWFRMGLFLLLSLFILAVSITFFALSMGEPYIGVTLSMNDGVWAVDGVDANGTARQVGINEGDRPIEINGQSAQIFLEKYRKTGAVFGSLIKELTVVDNSGQLKSITLKSGVLTWQSVVDQIARFAVTLIFWITGFYVLFKRPRSIVASLLCLTSLVFGLVISGNMAADMAIPTALELQVAATIFGPWLLLHLFLVLPEERTWLHYKPLLYLIYLPAAVTLILFFIVGYADGQPVQWFRNVRTIEAGAGFMAVIGVAIFNYFGSVYIRTRQQMKIVSVACLAALVPYLVFYVLPQAISRQSVLPPEYSILFIGFIPIGIGYAVVTQKLMDIDVVIRRGIIYGLITLVMAAILSAGIFFVGNLRESVGVLEEILIALVLGGIATALFGPMKNGIESLVDRLFYKDRYDYRQIIQSLATSLNSVNDFTGASRLIVGTAIHTLNLAGGCLCVRAQSGSFEASAYQGTFADTSKRNQLLTLLSQRSQMIEFPNSASTFYSDLAFLIPLKTGEREVGILCLSQKITRQHFSSDDIYLLQGIASVAAIALHSTMLIRDVNIRDTFISVASHELRTPLTSIVGYSDLLLRRDPPEITRKQWLKNIFDNSQRIAAMVDELLNVSRIRSGKVNIKLEKIRLAGILEETLSLTKEGTDKHEFVVDIEPDLPDVIVDRDKFGQVVGNLLSNAVKYSPNGGRIILSARHDREQQRIVVSVADEGIGISPADKELLFTTFHRIQRPETRGIRGSGLGLYITKELTEAMGGKIWLESEVNKGSTFFISIPSQGSQGTAEKDGLFA